MNRYDKQESRNGEIEIFLEKFHCNLKIRLIFITT
jgi:hypothetical protein